MIIIRQKRYSEDEKQGMSTGKKVALGIGGTALAAGAAFAGARRGMLGNRAAISTNRVWGNAGQTFGSTRMINSASKYTGKAVTNMATSAGMNGTAAASLGDYTANTLKNGWNSGNKINMSGKQMYEGLNNQIKTDMAVSPNLRKSGPLALNQ